MQSRTRRGRTLPLCRVGVWVWLLACRSTDPVDAAVAGSSGASSNPGSMGGDGGAAGAPDAPPEGAAHVGPCRVFPADNPWNLDVSGLPLHARSDAFIDFIGRDERVHPDFGTEWEGAPIGIPVVTVDAAQPDVGIEFTAYGDESDEGPYPVPADAPVEGGPDGDGDRHVLVVDTDSCVAYELYRAFPEGDGSWTADSGAVFDLRSNDEHPFGWTSADAAGLPILPGLVRYDEVVEDGALHHAVRFTASRTARALIPPARHHAGTSDDPDAPPMGLRLRLRADFDCSEYSAPARVVCAGLQRYGLLLADNGSDWYLSGVPDPRWDDDALGDLKQIPGAAFEVVDTGPSQSY
jgi:hypothetical protein